MVYIFRYKNYEVTDYYLNTIEEAFLELGYGVKNICKINKDISNGAIIIVSTIIDVLKCYLKGYHNIFLWMQGIDAEESYLKHNNLIKKKVLEFLTFISIRLVKGIFFVSNEMKDYIEKKYHKKNPFFIMPCFNTQLNAESFYFKNKYKNNIFTYVGSLSKWQCFDETIDFYKKIENKIPNSQLKVYTFSVQEAEEILRKKGVKKYHVEKVETIDMAKVLKEAKFGFTLRQDIIVNNVATPTKLSSYLSAGVIPIFSTCIRDFYRQTYNQKYVIPIENFNDISPAILNFCNSDINPNEIYNEYKYIFSMYYSREKYKKNMKIWIRGLLGELKNV